MYSGLRVARRRTINDTQGDGRCAGVMVCMRTCCDVQNESRVELGRPQGLSQHLSKKGENVVKGDREIVSGLQV